MAVRSRPSTRPAEVGTLVGDASHAHEVLGWRPTVTARELSSEMVAADLESARTDEVREGAAMHALDPST